MHGSATPLHCHALELSIRHRSVSSSSFRKASPTPAAWRKRGSCGTTRSSLPPSSAGVPPVSPRGEASSPGHPRRLLVSQLPLRNTQPGLSCPIRHNSPAFHFQRPMRSLLSAARCAIGMPGTLGRGAHLLVGAFSIGHPLAYPGTTIGQYPGVPMGHTLECFGKPMKQRYHWQMRGQQHRWRCMAFEPELTWTAPLSPYETLGLDRNATLEDVKAGYRRMAKTFHPDVYNGTPALENEETVESRFIQIQAAYELLSETDKRQQYDLDTRTNPNKASKAWRDWILRKKKSFEQRGELAFSAWAEQQQRELSLKARQMSRSKDDPGEEKRLLAKEKAATMENFETTLKRHTLVLKKRDIVRRRDEEAARKWLVADLLASEGLEIEEE